MAGGYEPKKCFVPVPFGKRGKELLHLIRTCANKNAIKNMDFNMNLIKSFFS